MTTFLQLSGTYLTHSARNVCRACNQTGHIIRVIEAPDALNANVAVWKRQSVAATKRHYASVHPEIQLPS